MPEVFTKSKRSQVMSLIRSKGNKDTEIKLAAIFRAEGITGWRRHLALPGKPDFTFRQERLTIFVDGCFWHGCPKHGRNPTSNRSYWLPKLRRNRERDAAVTSALAKAGWVVIRLWEHDLSAPLSVAGRVRRVLTRLKCRRK